MNTIIGLLSLAGTMIATQQFMKNAFLLPACFTNRHEKMLKSSMEAVQRDMKASGYEKRLFAELDKQLAASIKAEAEAQEKKNWLQFNSDSKALD